MMSAPRDEVVNDLLTVVGSVNADIYIEVDRMPTKGETISATNHDSGYMLPGGKGANQAVACSKLCGQSRFIGMFGNDAYAAKLRAVLCANHVDTTLCECVDKPSGQAYIFLHDDGDNSIIIVGAANAQWPDTLSDRMKTAIQSGSLVLLQREVPDTVNMAVAKVAYEARVRVIMDVGGRNTPLHPDILPYIYILSPNETELSRITGKPTESRQQVIDAARCLVDQGVRHVLVKLGARGSLAYSHDGVCIEQAAIRPDKIVDTTGAGDAFTGAVAVALAEGKTLQDAMKFAAATATLAIQKIGAMPSMPTRADVDALMNTTTVL